MRLHGRDCKGGNLERDCFLHSCPYGDTQYCGSDCCKRDYFYPLQKGHRGCFPAVVALAQRGWSLYLAQVSDRPGSTFPRQRCWRCGSRCSAARLRRHAVGSARWGIRSSIPALGSLPVETPAKVRKQCVNAMASTACRECCCHAKKINLHKATVKIEALFDMSF